MPRKSKVVPIWSSPHETHPERAAEQDRAAGGRSKRTVRLGSGTTALASVQLKPYKKAGTARTTPYAYVRFYVHGQTRAIAIGPVAAPTREAALSEAWQTVHERGLLMNL